MEIIGQKKGLFKQLLKWLEEPGRESDKGKVYIQTYNPDNYAILCSQKQDYKKFYDGEIILRKNLNYPPFCDIILLRIHSENKEKVQKVSEEIYRGLINQKNENLMIYKPVPSPIDKIQNTYRWRIVIKGRLNKRALSTINNVVKPFYNGKNKDVNIIVDSNPNNML
ncbi:MAG: hypothetical protein HFJ25_00445 [Clostridia bacterium]|nr:hypothetical protein [Clostridia bacterium]